MLIPYSTDAPIYYWPFATVGLIVANVLAFVVGWPMLLDDNETAINLWILILGDGIRPWQWLTSIFMHGNPLHLLSNMVFLWVFGLIVEGKLGWWKFLLLYLGLGVGEAALEQLMMLGASEIGFSLGASAAIYSIMAIALVWAPRNEIQCLYWFGWIFVGTIDISVVFFACIYLGLDLLGIALAAALSGDMMNAGWVHMTGALIGAPIGVAMVKLKWVDCEGWDILNAWQGSLPADEPDYKKIDEEVQRKKQAKETRHLDAAKEQFNTYLNDGNVRAAAALYGKMQQVGDGIQLERDELVAVIRGLHKEKLWGASAAFMHELISRFPAGSDPVKLKLAQICVTEFQKPARALELLQGIDYAQQPEKKELAKKIARKAKQLLAEGVYELDDNSW